MSWNVSMLRACVHAWGRIEFLTLLAQLSNVIFGHFLPAHALMIYLARYSVCCLRDRFLHKNQYIIYLSGR